MKVIATGLLAVTLIAATGGARAEGLYIGGNVGSSNYKGAAVGGAETDRSDTGWKGYVGWSFTPNFALEAGHAQLGRFDSASSQLKARGQYLDLVGSVPLTGPLSAFGRVGVFNARAKDTLLGHDSGANIKVGAGLQYDLTKNVGLRGEWERYRIDDFGAKANTDLYSVGVVYKF